MMLGSLQDGAKKKGKGWGKSNKSKGTELYRAGAWQRTTMTKESCIRRGKQLYATYFSNWRDLIVYKAWTHTREEAGYLNQVNRPCR
jgi:hypothetical protein